VTLASIPEELTVIAYTISTLIILSGAVAWFAGAGALQQPAAVYIWASGVVLLGYGLIRDLVLIARGLEEDEAGTQRKMAVICLESTLGLLLFAIGISLHILHWTPVLALPVGAALVGAGVIVAFGHATRDWVLILARVENHHNLIPTWNVDAFDEKHPNGNEP
jgi:putative Mn2+ efflux pump MntP